MCVVQTQPHQLLPSLSGSMYTVGHADQHAVTTYWTIIHCMHMIRPLGGGNVETAEVCLEVNYCYYELVVYFHFRFLWWVVNVVSA